jgi:hypothetical protein
MHAYMYACVYAFMWCIALIFDRIITLAIFIHFSLLYVHFFLYENNCYFFFSNTKLNEEHFSLTYCFVSGVRKDIELGQGISGMRWRVREQHRSMVDQVREATRDPEAMRWSGVCSIVASAIRR